MAVASVLISMAVKGQEAINSARVKELSVDFKNIPLLIYDYQDKFKALPGDDAKAAAHVSATTAGNGNGVISGNWNSTNISDESYLFWQHVRLAGLASGTSDIAAAAYRPTNSLGSAIGIQSANHCTAAGVPNAACTSSNLTQIKDAAGNAISGTYVICSSGIPGKYVKQLDLAMDDGHTDSGLMMATPTTNHTIGVAATATNAIDDAILYDVCMGV
jgi:hypothetical protein